MELRYYQHDALNAIIDGEREYDKQLVVMPTGAGKTILFSKLAEKKLPQRTLILADKENLVEQACDKIWQSVKIEAGREQGKSKADKDNAIVVATVQSMIHRLDRWPRDHFDTIVCDEAQHVLADSWQTVLAHFDNHAKVVGVTATPFRGDRRNLATYFDQKTYEIGLRQLINDGYLCPIRLKALPVQIDISGVSSVAGDFHAGRLHDTLTPLLHNIAEQIKENAEGRKILAFLPLIETSKQFVKICNDVGLTATHVSSQEKEKHTILKHFASCDGELMGNAMILSEGYDNPKIDCIVNLRPTRSTTLYCQMMGRGTRIAHGKDDLLILDFLWHHERHSLVRPANLFAEDQETADIMTRRSMGGEEEDLMGLERDAVAERRRTLEEQIRANRQRKTKTIDPTELSLALGSVVNATYEPVFSWEFDPITPKQRAALERQKIDVTEVETKGHAAKLLGMILPRYSQKLATPKQVMTLRKLRHPNPETATFSEASSYISRMFTR